MKKFSDSFDLRDAIFKHLRLIEEAEVFVIFTEASKTSARVILDLLVGLMWQNLRKNLTGAGIIMQADVLWIVQCLKQKRK